MLPTSHVLLLLALTLSQIPKDDPISDQSLHPLCSVSLSSLTLYCTCSQSQAPRRFTKATMMSLVKVGNISRYG